MFKRANKITSLLVAAAAVASMVPAYAADVKKLDSQDGTVYNAVAYKDGESYIDGEINDKDEATYYVANSKYNNLSDIDSGADVSAYGDKYVEEQDGDYYLDLSNGKVTDDSVADNARDDAASALRKKAKADTDGRYLKDGSAFAADYTQTGWSVSTEIPGAKFGDIWYATKLANKDAANNFAPNGDGTSAGTLNVFTDANGNYIDADYSLGKIKVTTTASGVGSKSVYVDNTTDTYDAAGKSGAVTAYVRQDKVLTQDKDYIYRKVNVTVAVSTASGVTATISQIGGENIGGDSAFQTSDAGKTVTFAAIQKIAKAQDSDTIGGAKYSKSVETYAISDDNGVSTDKAQDFAGLTYYTATNGKLTGYSIDTGANTVTVQTATLKSNNGLYYTDLGDKSDADDIEASDINSSATTKDIEDKASSVQVDADGNLWRLNNGYIYEWDNDSSWNKVYKVDGSINKMSVYDKDNIVAWNQDDEVYTVLGGKGTKATDDGTTTTTTTTTTAAAGWVKAADGTWSYNKADGTKATGWLQAGSAWYFLKADGTMATGWVQDGATWYYLQASGAMATGWLNDNGTWYYLNASGAMLANTTVDGYVLGASGAWIQ